MVEEDILGPQSEATGETYVQCGHCGRSFLQRRTAPVEASVLEPTLSELENLCPDCQRAAEELHEDQQYPTEGEEQR